MAIVPEKRTPWDIIRGIYIRVLTVLAYPAFPYQVTGFLHRLRGVKLGKQSHIARFVYIDDRYPQLINIGNEVGITAGVMIVAHKRDLTNYKPGMLSMDNPFTVKPVTIKDGAHIGMGSIILPGVTIGEGAIIGAGSVVSRDVPPYSVAVGIPARVVKTFTKD